MFDDLWTWETPFSGDFPLLRSLLEDLLSPAAGIADLRSVPRGSFPVVNVGETTDAVHVYAFLPGVARDSLEVNVEGNLLTISGTRDAPQTEEGVSWYRNERFAGEFTRSLALPDTVDPNQVEATLKNGVLTVQLRKRAEMRPRRLEVKAA